VALDPSGYPGPLLLAGALRRRAGSLHGWQEKEKEIEEGDACQPAPFCTCGTAHSRGARRVAAYGTPIVGAVPDDADGRTDDGRDGADGADCHAHDGRDCCPDDADRGSYFDIDNAGAGDTWVSLSSRRATKDCKKLPINLPALRWTKFPDRADV